MRWVPGHEVGRAVNHELRLLSTLVAALALLLQACSGGAGSEPSDSGGNEADGIVRLQGVAIDSVLNEVEAEYAEILRFAMANVPSPLPAQAVSLVKFVAGQKPSPTGPRLSVPSDGILRTEVFISNPGSNGVDLMVLCVRNIVQIPCSSSARVWHVVLSPSMFARAQVVAPVENGDTLHFLLLVAGDRVRPFPASSEIHVSVGAPSKRHDVIPSSGHDPIFEGCDFATLTADLKPHQSFQRPKAQSLAGALYLVVQPACDGSNTNETVQAVGVVDRTTVVTFPGLDAPTSIDGRALVEPIPRWKVLRPGTELQVIVMREGKHSWITHPVTFV